MPIQEVHGGARNLVCSMYVLHLHHFGVIAFVWMLLRGWCEDEFQEAQGVQGEWLHPMTDTGDGDPCQWMGIQHHPTTTCKSPWQELFASRFHVNHLPACRWIKGLMSTWGCKRSSNDGQLGHTCYLFAALSLSLSAFLVFSYLFFTLASGRSCQAGDTWRQFEKSKVWKVLLTHQSCAPASSCPFCVITSNVVRVVVLVKDFRMLLPVIFVFHHNISQLIFLALRCYFELAQVIFCPLVAELLDPSMRPRHWTALVNLCGASKVICWYANHVRSRSWHLEVS